MCVCSLPFRSSHKHDTHHYAAFMRYVRGFTLLLSGFLILPLAEQGVVNVCNELSGRSHGILNVCNDLSACCMHKSWTGIDKSAEEPGKFLNLSFSRVKPTLDAVTGDSNYYTIRSQTL